MTNAAYFFFVLLTSLLASLAQDEHDDATQRAQPVQLSIDTIGIDAPVLPVDVRQDGSMEAPDTAGDVGWYAPGFIPGEKGNAVLAGHLDTESGKPAVFWRLRELEPGDEVRILLSDGTDVRFVVTDRSIFEMDDEPLAHLFGSSSGSFVHLVTCGGGWREDLQTYERHLIVTARRADDR